MQNSSDDQQYQNDVLITSQDRRREVDPEKIKTFPYNCIGLIIGATKDNQNEGKGTGFLISSNLILTVAHNVINRAKKINYQFVSFQFYPAICIENRECFEVETAKVSPQYIQAFYPKQMGILDRIANFFTNAEKDLAKNLMFNDYALLKLKKPVQRQKYFTLSELDLKDQISIYGYPGDLATRDYNQKWIGSQKGHSEKPDHIENGMVYYKIDSTSGQSGCPIFNSKNQVVGIHKGAPNVAKGSTEKYNFGVLLTSKIVLQLRKWGNQLKASQFDATFNLSFEWNNFFIDSSQFSFNDKRVEKLKEDDRRYQILGLHPLSQNKSKITFKVVNYGGNSSIIFGILTQSRKSQQWSGHIGHKESVGFWTNSTNVGMINVDGEKKVDWSGKLFVHPQTLLIMQFDKVANSIKFANPSNQNSQWQFQLQNSFKNKLIYSFAVMSNKGDVIQVVE